MKKKNNYFEQKYKRKILPERILVKLNDNKTSHSEPWKNDLN